MIRLINWLLIQSSNSFFQITQPLKYPSKRGQKVFKDCTMVLPNFSRNKKPYWLGSVSFETWHPKVRLSTETIWGIFAGLAIGQIILSLRWKTVVSVFLLAVNSVCAFVLVNRNTETTLVPLKQQLYCSLCPFVM